MMKTSEFNDYLHNHRISIFTLKDASRIINKPGHYTVVFLSRNKQIKSAEKGVYYTKEANEYEVASRIVFPSYISLISSLRFHNLTEQIPNIIYVVSHKRHRAIKDLNGYRVEFRTVKKKLMYGYAKIDGVFVAEPEKAIIDMLYLGLFTEYVEEALETGRLAEERLKKYAAMTENKSLIRKTAMLLKHD